MPADQPFALLPSPGTYRTAIRSSIRLPIGKPTPPGEGCAVDGLLEGNGWGRASPVAAVVGATSKQR